MADGLLIYNVNAPFWVVKNYLVKMPEPLDKVVDCVGDGPSRDSVQHGQELLKGHPCVLLPLQEMTMIDDDDEQGFIFITRNTVPTC